VSVPASSPLMIVDDDDDLRNTLAEILTAQGYQVAAFGDARAALAALEDGRTPFLILLDLMMPGMSGWEFRAAQLENATLAPIPVVVVTAANVLNNGVHSLSDLEILRKPFDLEALLAVVDRYNAVARARP
jgi:two-component system, chemotaxis family, chemotaxis protein CheY